MAKKETSSDEIKEIECEKCSASVELASREANRCPNCGLTYDGNGYVITESIYCFGCDEIVYLLSQERNECESCGLEYDGAGDPVVNAPPPGTYIGEQWIVTLAHYYYVDRNDDGTWTVYYHCSHPDDFVEEGPYDADDLLEALEEIGFEREEVIEKEIEGLNSALKKRPTPPG